MMDSKFYRKRSVIVLMMLRLVTLGIYPIFYFFGKLKELNPELAKKTNRSLITAVAMVIMLGLIYLGYTSETREGSKDMYEWVQIVAWFYEIYLIMTIRRQLMTLGSELKINRFWAILFQDLYLQYRINKFLKK